MAYPRFQRARSFKFVAGTLAGDHTSTSTTFADINAAYQMVLNAQANDVLRLYMRGQFIYSGTAQLFDLTWNVAGGGGDITPWASQVVGSTNSLQQDCETYYTVQVSDLTNGLVTVKPRWKVTTSQTITLTNSSSRGPMFVAQNLGPIDPN